MKTDVKTQLRRDLERGMSITSLTALRRYGTLRLSVYVHRLRNEGMNIITKMTTYKDSTYAVYYLNKKS